MNNAGIIVATVVVSGSSVLKNVLTDNTVNVNTVARPIVAGFLLGLVLFAVNMVSNTLALALAVLMVTAALLTNGELIFRSIQKLV